MIAYTWNAQSRLWEAQAEIVPPGLTSHDSFGQSVAFRYESTSDRWLLAAGSQSRNTSEPNTGTAYIFELDPSGKWELQAELLPEPLVPEGWFGTDVTWLEAGVRDLLVVGGPGSEANGLPGHAYVFEQDSNGIWEQRSRLTAPDGGQPNGAFAWSTDAAESDGVTVLAIGEPVFNFVRDVAPGTVWFYRFEPVASDWILEAEIQAPDPYAQDLFGWSVSLGAVTGEPGITHRAVVGRPHDGGFGAPEGPGAAFVYIREVSGVWRLEQRIEPPYTNPQTQEFGWSVDVEKVGASKLIVGGPVDNTFGQYAGSAFVFKRNQQGTWIPIQRLDGRDEDAGDGFGWGVALGNGRSDGVAVVGASATQCSGGTQYDSVGAVYSFDLEPGEGSTCPPPVLTLQKIPDCSSGSGGELEVRWFQATPDRSARVAILYGRRTGGFVIPNGNPCAGTSLGLGALELQVAFTGSAGQFGAGRVIANIPRAACGGYLQLVDIARCEVSNVVRIE